MKKSAVKIKSILAVNPISGYYQRPQRLPGGHSRIVFRRDSTASLWKTVLSWCQRFVLLPVPREIRSLYHRIVLEKRTGTVLPYQAVQQSLPRLEVCDPPVEPPCSYGIRALAKERPWLTIADCELFLQGWFQSEQYRARMGN